MKKTLVALAVLAASGASFAQVTITGTVSLGYEADHHATGSVLGDTSGLGVDTTVLDFKATEDLGAGMKATAAMQFDGVNRGGASGGDASLSLSGSFGTLTLANAKGADYLSGGVATVGGNGFDGKVFSTRTNADSISYAYPMGAVTLSAAHSEPSNTIGLGAGAAGAQATYTYKNFDGTESTAEVQRSTRIAAKYTAGALIIDGGYAVYDQQGTTEANDKSQVRASGSYDLGMVKLGGGVVRNTKNVGTRTDWLVSAGLPLGALTLGANYAIRTTNDYSDNAKNGTINGYGLSVSYALSKRTSLSGAYTNFKQTLTASENSSYTAALINHSF